MLFHPAKVPLKVYSILSKIHSACCAHFMGYHLTKQIYCSQDCTKKSNTVSNLGFQTKYTQKPWNMPFHPDKVLLEGFAIPSKILSTYYVLNQDLDFSLQVTFFQNLRCVLMKKVHQTIGLLWKNFSIQWNFLVVLLMMK